MTTAYAFGVRDRDRVPAWATRPAPAPAPARPLWYLLPGGRPVRPPGKGMPLRDEPTHFCHEGDPRWRPIDEL